MLQIKSTFDYQTVAVDKILIDIVNILVIRDMHVERKDVVAGICTCMFLLHFNGSQLTSGINGLQTVPVSGYTHKG